MDIRQVNAVTRVKYKKEIDKILETLSSMNLKPQSEVDIYNDRPYGWHGVVIADNSVYVFKCFGDHIYQQSIEPIYGFYRNGRIIRKTDQLIDLFKALEAHDEEEIMRIANELFITLNGQTNWSAVEEFELFATCMVFPLVVDTTKWRVGEIHYDGHVYSYGWFTN